MPELPSCSVAKSGRLLCVLQLRHGEMPANSGGQWLLRLSAGLVGAAEAASLLGAVSQRSPLLREFQLFAERSIAAGASVLKAYLSTYRQTAIYARTEWANCDQAVS